MKGWRQFTKWLTDRQVICGVTIPGSVIESWKEWFEKEEFKTEIRILEGRRALFVFDAVRGDSGTNKENLKKTSSS